MLVSMEIVFDREPTGESVSSVARVRWAWVGSGALLAIVIALVVLRVSEPTSQKGAQAMPAGSFVLEQAAFDGWEPLAPTAGELRAGFPAPMVWKGDRVCIGLARTDFGPEDFRPSTARCERQRAENMASNEIRSLLSIRSGFDTWHFIEAPGDIDAIKVRLATGAALGGERIHLSGSTAALRLEDGRDLASIEWSTKSLRYRCLPDPTAWRTSKFCADAD
jgi:hypothetical protein|tara:strand:+ start:3744 stop:4406 length:663 start_codon:yes stop_codon:yes gene_type:complete